MLVGGLPWADSTLGEGAPLTSTYPSGSNPAGDKGPGGDSATTRRLIPATPSVVDVTHRGWVSLRVSAGRRPAPFKPPIGHLR